jgi:hypothetical protein
MRHLLTGVAVVAVLAISAPVSAQPANPSGGAQTPYTTGAPPAPTPSGQMPAGGRRTSGERIPPIMPSTPSASDTTSAAPPAHHHAGVHHAMHGRMAHGPKSTTDTAAELNQAELARLQAGAPPMAPQMAPQTAPPPAMSGGNSMGMPGPNTGGPGLTPYSGGAPQR